MAIGRVRSRCRSYQLFPSRDSEPGTETGIGSSNDTLACRLGEVATDASAVATPVDRSSSCATTSGDGVPSFSDWIVPATRLRA